MKKNFKLHQLLWSCLLPLLLLLIAPLSSSKPYLATLLGTLSPLHAASNNQSDVEHQLQIQLEMPDAPAGTPATLEPGGSPLRFNVTVRNSGVTTVTNVTVVAEHETEYLKIDLNSQTYEKEEDKEATSSSLDEQGNLRWQIGQILPEEEWQVTYLATPQDEFQFTSVENLNEADDGYAGLIPVITRATAQVGNQELVQATSAVEIQLPGNGLSVTKETRQSGDCPGQSNTTMGVDGTAEFVLMVKNETSGYIFTDLRLIDLFEGDQGESRVDSVTVISTEPPTEETLFLQREGTIEWPINRLRPGKFWCVRYRTTIAYGESREITNRSFVQIAGQSYLGTEHQRLLVQVPQLSLTQRIEWPEGQPETQGIYKPGDKVQYVLTYANKGTGEATNVSLTQRFDPTVFNTIVDGDALSAPDGDVNENAILWSLGTLSAGEQGEIRWDLPLRSDLLVGESTLTSQAALAADNLVAATAEESSFTIHSPELSIEITPQDLNGGKINPGDKLLVLIRLANEGKVAATDLEISSAIANQLGAELANISDSGEPTDQSGVVGWTWPALEPNGVETFSYELQIPGNINELTNIDGTVSVVASGADSPLATNTNFAVEPAERSPAPIAEAAIPSLQQNFPLIATLVGGLILGAFFLVGYYARYLMLEEQLESHFREVVEMFTIVIIVAAVLVLAMVSSLGSNAAVSVLSGIAGYVLGRGSNGR
ncbi:MAG: hypothetical protein AAF702_29690 [Chloroflexota bacterium]